MVKLTQNEKRALKILIEDGKATDTKIAKQLRITKQAVGKIRRKLESLGIIKRYSTVIDYGKLGVNTFALAVLRFNLKAWEELGELGIEKKLTEIPHVISIFRIPQGPATHIALYGFRNLNELDDHFRDLKTKPAFNQFMEIRDTYIFSQHSLIKDTPVELLHKVIDEFGKPKQPALLLSGEIDKFRKNVLGNLE